MNSSDKSWSTLTSISCLIYVSLLLKFTVTLRDTVLYKIFQFVWFRDEKVSSEVLFICSTKLKCVSAGYPVYQIPHPTLPAEIHWKGTRKNYMYKISWHHPGYKTILVISYWTISQQSTERTNLLKKGLTATKWEPLKTCPQHTKPYVKRIHCWCTHSLQQHQPLQSKVQNNALRILTGEAKCCLAM